MPAHCQPEGLDIDLGRDDRPVPAHVEPVVGREDRLIENLERRFEQRRAGALKDECPFLGKGRSDGPLVRPAWQGQLYRRVGKSAHGGQRQGRSPGPSKKVPPGGERAREEHLFHGRISD